MTRSLKVNQILKRENSILAALARGASTESILLDVISELESVSGDLLGSVLRLDPSTQKLHVIAAPNLPAGYNQVIDGVMIGDGVGSCGTAAFHGVPIVVEDIRTHPFWGAFREVAEQHRLRACWSTPILSSRGKVLGTFACYYHEAKLPTDEEWEFLGRLTHLAAIAMERHSDNEERQQGDANASALIPRIARCLANDLAPTVEQLSNQHRQLRERFKENPDALSELGLMREPLNSLHSCLNQLLVVGGQFRTSSKKCDIAEIVSQSLLRLRTLYQPAPSIEFNIAPQPGTIFIDPSALDLALRLIVQALIAAGTEISHLAITAQTPRADQLSNLFLTIHGTPLPSRPADRFFEIPSSSQANSIAETLGPSTVKTLVEQMQGTIVARRENESAIVFALEFPSVPIPTTPPATTRETPKNPTAQPLVPIGSTVLVVDDDETIRTAIEGLLRARNFEVKTAKEGKEALQIAEQANVPIGVVVTDVRMPEMNGKELSRELRKRHPNVQIVMISGHTGGLTTDDWLREHGITLLAKPFTHTELLQGVRDAFARYHSATP